MFELLIVFLFLSILLNVFLIFHKIKSKPQKKLDLSAQELLSEILAGPAVVRIDVIEKDSILMWKGRH